MIEFFHQNAPATVRLGSIGTALLAVADAVVRVRGFKSVPDPEFALSSTLLRAALGLVVGLTFAWGIARMHGVFYWCWFAVSLVIITVVLVVPIWRLVSISAGIGAIAIGSEAVVIGVLWLVTAGLLLAPSSIRAFWHRG